MITVLSSPKAGSGTSTTVALLALAFCYDTPVHVVDLCGDQIAVLGLTDRPNTRSQVAGRISVHDLADSTTGEQLAVIDRLARLGEHVIEPSDQSPAAGQHRPPVGPAPACYLSLRRASACPVRPDEVVLLDELGRALTARDVQAVTGAPVTATVEVQPQIARAVDAGLLTARAPATALAALEPLARTNEAA
jgi:hypothetical protein